MNQQILNIATLKSHPHHAIVAGGRILPDVFCACIFQYMWVRFNNPNTTHEIILWMTKSNLKVMQDVLQKWMGKTSPLTWPPTTCIQRRKENTHQELYVTVFGSMNSLHLIFKQKQRLCVERGYILLPSDGFTHKNKLWRKNQTGLFASSTLPQAIDNTNLVEWNGVGFSQRRIGRAVLSELIVEFSKMIKWGKFTKPLRKWLECAFWCIWYASDEAQNGDDIDKKALQIIVASSSNMIRELRKCTDIFPLQQYDIIRTVFWNIHYFGPNFNSEFVFQVGVVMVEVALEHPVSLLVYLANAMQSARTFIIFLFATPTIRVWVTGNMNGRARMWLKYLNLLGFTQADDQHNLLNLYELHKRTSRRQINRVNWLSEYHELLKCIYLYTCNTAKGGVLASDVDKYMSKAPPEKLSLMDIAKRENGSNG